MRLLAARDRSEHELRVRLAAAPPDVIAAVIERLHHFGYLDEVRFARGLAERLVRRGYGSERARLEMAEHRLAHELIEDAVAAMAAGDAERAREFLARRYPGKQATPAARARAARFLLARGYPDEVVHDVVEAAAE